MAAPHQASPFDTSRTVAHRRKRQKKGGNQTARSSLYLPGGHVLLFLIHSVRLGKSCPDLRRNGPGRSRSRMVCLIFSPRTELPAEHIRRRAQHASAFLNLRLALALCTELFSKAAAFRAVQEPGGTRTKASHCKIESHHNTTHPLAYNLFFCSLFFPK
jgi:hypothetical protein